MSQEKVERYKEQKANRKKIMRKEKIANIVRKCVLAAACLGIIGWLGVSAYGTYKSNQPRETVEVNYDAVETYINGLYAAEEETAE